MFRKTAKEGGRPLRGLTLATKRIVIALGFVAFAGVGFTGVTYALAPSASMPANLPVASLPVADLSAIPSQTQQTIQSAVGSPLGDRAGLTSGSLSGSRILGSTDAGPLVVVPGSGGSLCIAIMYAISCGDSSAPNQDGVVVSLYAEAPDGKSYGGAITTQNVTQAELVLQDGSSDPTVPTSGGFIYNGGGTPIAPGNELKSESVQNYYS